MVVFCSFPFDMRNKVCLKVNWWRAESIDWSEIVVLQDEQDVQVFDAKVLMCQLKQEMILTETEIEILEVGLDRHCLELCPQEEFSLFLSPLLHSPKEKIQRNIDYHS